MPIFKTPFSGAYWRTAALEVKNYRSIVFSALMIAACIVLSHCTIRVGEGLSISVTFLARALCSLVCGPVMVILFGAAEDTLSFFLSSGGYAYFPGYSIGPGSPGAASSWQSSSPTSKMFFWALCGALFSTARDTCIIWPPVP